MKITTYNEWLNENQSPINEGAVDPRVKKEAISRLSDFFRVPANALNGFNFDGKDNIKALTKALNSTSDQGTELYYKTAIKLAMEEVGVNESAKPKVGDELTMVKSGKKGKVVKCMGDMCNVDFGNGDVYGITYRRIKGDQITEESVNEGRAKEFEMDYAQLVKDIKSGFGWVDPSYVGDMWEEMNFNSIDFDIVRDEVMNRLIKADMLYYPDPKDPESKGKKVTNISQIRY